MHIQFSRRYGNAWTASRVMLPSNHSIACSCIYLLYTYFDTCFCYFQVHGKCACVCVCVCVCVWACSCIHLWLFVSTYVGCMLTVNVNMLANYCFCCCFFLTEYACMCARMHLGSYMCAPPGIGCVRSTRIKAIRVMSQTDPFIFVFRRERVGGGEGERENENKSYLEES